MSIEHQIASELQVRPQQVEATIRLLDEGASVPFIARYRKEVTGALDDGQLRTLAERLGYLRELNARRDTVLNSIREQGKLTTQLEQQILAADSKGRLEDLYLPYRPKRRSKAEKAREAGLEPLAERLLQEPSANPQQVAKPFVQGDIASTEDALEGARQILIERFAEDAELLGNLRRWLQQQGELQVRAARGKADDNSKFRDYFDYREPLRKVPSHRALAILRGHQEGILRYSLLPPEGLEQEGSTRIGRHWRLQGRWLLDCAEQCWKQKLQPQLENDLIKQLREQAEQEAIKVFADNLKDLLLAAPAGPRATLGLDPGLRTGVKVAVVDATGKLLDTATIYPHVPKKQWDQSLATLTALTKKHRVELISIGNGTASRETEQLARELVKQLPAQQLTAVMVSEAGASVYSASETAAAEFPQLDVSLRGAVSIARRLQDPLAELVKIEAKAIGVGQYQHDVDQNRLADSLAAVVEDCVNHVGVDVNTASAELLSQVAGLNRATAANIVAYRDQHGRFQDRKQLLKVARLGPKAFEQCAGFLRIQDGDNPLDNSAVHPESYPLVARLAEQLNCTLAELVGDRQRLQQVQQALKLALAEQFGQYTVTDVLNELEKPGRDPRPEFRAAQFADGVETLADLAPGMALEGVVTNVTNFGAFVDIGVHQDGLVHISQLADRFVSDPRELVKAGDIVQVRVLEVDQNRRRISLTMKKAASDGERPPADRRSQDRPKPGRKPAAKGERQGPANNSLAAKLKEAGLG
ncbi:Tex family protein [Marinobacterium arenosum]|uniref:Tex family protein n=1 Tax=Marinobacterium arenosum TaxID=2862496 RepID=UPI001C953B8D|nr:Tex family protein [Marinobacterium arenosum]MBY4675597.1 RNA-binding transcriptional accessory protein [Marinobacterium arenosum]